jgi:guanosine-3',5'-bis(diphosphate) 3'-pyrophosphohydrolase
MTEKLHENQPPLVAALEYAQLLHEKQLISGTNEPYFAHICRVFGYTKKFVGKNLLLRTDALMMAALHDTIEDTEVSYVQIEQKFGTFIADGVAALSKNSRLPKGLQMADSLNRILAHSREARVVKIADRTDNISVPHPFWTDEKKLEYLKESLLIYQTLSGVTPEGDAELALKIVNFYTHFKSEEYAVPVKSLLQNFPNFDRKNSGNFILEF